MPALADLVLAHPANAALRRHFTAPPRRADTPAAASPQSVPDPYYTLGTHPDLVARLWDELGKVLPQDCRAIFHGAPALIHPGTGIVFGFAGGTHTYALRLPAPERQAALDAGATRIKTYPRQPPLDLADLGEEWVFGGWLAGESQWCLAAFEAASERSSEGKRRAPGH